MFLKDLSLTTIAIDKNVYSGSLIKEKNVVLKYLYSFEPYAVSGGLVVDEITQKEVIDVPFTIYSDGVYIWNTSYIYHFEKYDMPLKQEFIDYVLSK